MTLEGQADAIMSGSVPWDVKTLPAVTGARRLIASTIDQLPLVIARDDGKPAPASEWLQQPDDYGSSMDRGDLVQFCVDSMILHGKAYLWLTRTVDRAWLIEPIDTKMVTAARVPGPVVRLGFSVSGWGDVQLAPRRVTDTPGSGPYLVHIPYVVTVDHPEGTTPLVESAPMLRGLIDTERHTSELFASGTHVGGILSTEFDITTEQAKAWQDAWIVARQTGRIPVLGNGLTYRNDFPNARDLQMVEARSFNQSVVWALLGIPQAYMGSSLMGGQSSLSYANAQDNRRQFADNCLRAFTTQIEDALSRVLAPERVRARFDYTEWEGRADDGAQNAAPVSVPSA